MDFSSNRVQEEELCKRENIFVLLVGAMAIALREERHTAIMIPEGAIIVLMNGSFDGTRLMDVRYEGEMIMMFTDDKKTHTEVVTKGSA